MSELIVYDDSIQMQIYLWFSGLNYHLAYCKPIDLSRLLAHIVEDRTK